MRTPNRNRILALMSVPAALVLLGAGSWGAGRVFHDPSLPSAQVVRFSYPVELRWNNREKAEF